MRRAAFVVGLGLGGFLDGIVLHQVLQWHHLLTSAGEPDDTVAGLEANTLADGLFHLSTWALVLAGVLLLARAWRAGEAPPRWQAVLGLLLAGWGVFNVVEGAVNHLVLGLHHVRDDLGGPLGWDLAFLALGLLLALGGRALARPPRPGAP